MTDVLLAAILAVSVLQLLNDTETGRRMWRRIGALLARRRAGRTRVGGNYAGE